MREAYASLLALSADEGAALETLSQARAELESGDPAALGLDAVDWAAIASKVFTEMATRQYRDQRDREHLRRLVAKHRREAENFERRLERRLEEHEREIEERAHNIRRLQRRNRALEAEISALRRSTSWRLTRPLRAVVRLISDPRGTIAFLRARRAGQPAPGPAAPRPAPKARAPVPDEEGPPPGLEKLSPENAARVREAFDAEYYLECYPDIAASSIDPFGHYMRHGWREERDPSPLFSTAYYLKHNPDVAGSGMNPFVHWVLHGSREKRPALPHHRRLELLEYRPKVSVIVPNYNHAPFLEQRIESILAQTYENIEVLILDDCSTDDSRAIIERYRARHPDRVRTLFNEANSGNVFRQWRKGLENSGGELVWICESDDFCEPDFLEGLVDKFKDHSVEIAFGRIQFSDRNGNLLQGLDQYREGAEPGIWKEPIVRPARRWFAGAFGVNNVIANVGGCVFRRQSLPEHVWREAEGYSILGDWFLYCHLAGGGQIAYEPSSVAYFRQHGGNTSVVAFTSTDYYEEHERLMLLLRRRWGVPDETVEAFYEKVAWQYGRHGLEEKLGSMESYCDKRRLLAQEREQPHILIGFLGFHPGGGEVFPIHLANTLRAQGHLVSMLAIDTSEVNPEMRDALDPAIPVYDATWVEEYGADRFLHDAGVSLIHSHMISVEAFFFERCRIETEIPYLVSLHGSYDYPPLGRERLLRILLGVSHFVYTADKNLEPFRPVPLSERAFTKLGNAVPDDPRPFPKTREELGIAGDAVVYTLVARGIQRKDWRASIAAFRALREAHPERKVHLLLCGTGEETDRYLALHGEDPDITFLGYQSRIHGLYRMSDVALVPTRFAGESYPLCMIQALQTGTPLIATRVGEIPGMMEGPDGPAGILIDYQRDTERFTRSLQEAMAAMLDGSTRDRYARAAREKGKTYSIEEVAREYAALYDRLLREQEAGAGRELVL